MKITLRTIGGFTGPAGAETSVLDVESMDKETAARLRGLVEESKFFSLPPKVTKAAPQPWDFVHDLTVEDSGRTHTVRFHDDAASDSLKALAASVREQPRSK